MSQDNLPNDARYCPSCGEPFSEGDVRLFADATLNRYRSSIECDDCGYSGEVIRKGGIDHMTPYGDEDSLWCGRHDQYEPKSNACDGAFDPDEVDWLVDKEASEV